MVLCQPELTDQRTGGNESDPGRARGGSGLGLSIETIASAHEGTARAANDPDGGARVSIELPVAGPAHRDAAPGQAGRRG